MLRKIGLCLFPIVVCIAVTSSIYPVFSRLGLISGKTISYFASLIDIVIRVTAGLLTFLLIVHCSKQLKLNPPVIGNSKGLLMGLSVGFITSVLSGILYFLVYHPACNINLFSSKLIRIAFMNIGVATIEEICFRGGAFYFANEFWGISTALLVGNVPFGLMHLLNIFIGQQVSSTYAVGTAVLGVLFSLVYLRFGVLAAVICHWFWNVLLSLWLKMFELPSLAAIEGAWTTILAIILTSIFLFIYSKKATVA